MPDRRLVLVGAGHAHLHLLRHADRLARAGWTTTLVAPRWFDYSGAASAIATGHREPAAGRIDVAALARARGVDHHDTVVTDVDIGARTVGTDHGATLSWDRVSFNLGSVAAVPDGVAVHDDVVRIKPLSSLALLRDRLRERPAGRGHRVTVVGGGASGVELAGHLAARPDVDVVRPLEAGPRLLPALPPRAARRVVRLLADRGVEVRTSIGLRDLGAPESVLADGTRLPHDIAILATGLAPSALATTPPLGGPDGIPVRATLQHVDHDDAYAVGDCADFRPGRLPRVGVYGVRQGPVLLAALEGEGAAPTYQPQRQALAILDLGGGTALSVRGRWWWLGRSSLALKRRIDDRWVSGYRT